MMWDAWLFEHPRSVGETYFEHQKRACSFSGRLLLASFACLVHAFVPRLFERTGSSAITALHDEMARRNARASLASRHYSPAPAE